MTDEELKATQESLARMLADYLQSQGGPRLRACAPAGLLVRLFVCLAALSCGLSPE